MNSGIIRNENRIQKIIKGSDKMRKRQSYKDLIDQNKKDLLKDEDALKKIERKLDDKHSNRL